MGCANHTTSVLVSELLEDGFDSCSEELCISRLARRGKSNVKLTVGVPMDNCDVTVEGSR